MAVSASHFRAIESGQLSLFGAHTGISDDIVLPLVNTEITRREILNWERELIGLYVSDHPLSPVMDLLTQAVSHFSGQLGEASPEEKVRVAGLITRMRTHITKTGKTMGFVTLEDIQGLVELVIFPRNWQKVEGEISVDEIVLVDGRVDNTRAEPKILVDRISTDLSVTTSAEPPPPALRPDRFIPDFDEIPIDPEWSPELEINNGKNGSEDSETAITTELDKGQDNEQNPDSFIPEGQTPLPGVEVTVPRVAISAAPENPAIIGGEKVEDLYEDWDDNDSWGSNSPPPPDGFLHNWEPVQETGVDIEVADKDQGKKTTPEPLSAVDNHETKPIEKGIGEDKSPLPAFILSPKPDDETSTAQMITVILRSTGDKTRDVLRLRRIHGIITSYPGRDRFAIQVYEKNQGFLVEFPNWTTHHCPELISRLNFLVGSENVTVEPIVYQ
jgi:DNA polymerase III subunit alpha